MSRINLNKLKKTVLHQANLETLWSQPIDRKQTLQEAMLKAALRHLHAIIENETDVAEASKRIYWNLESEL